LSRICPIRHEHQEKETAQEHTFSSCERTALEIGRARRCIGREESIKWTETGLREFYFIELKNLKPLDVMIMAENAIALGLRGQLRFHLSWSLEVNFPPLEFVEYKQVDDDGTRTWIMTARVPPGSRAAESTVHIIFRPGADGRFVRHAITIDGSPPRIRWSERTDLVFQPPRPMGWAGIVVP
jgi:hypothetical protein